MINSTTHNKDEKKYKNWKKDIIELYLEKKSTDVGTDEMLLVRICSGNEWRHTRKPSRMCGENEKIYNSIFTFKEYAPIEKNGGPLWKKNHMRRKGVQQLWVFNRGMLKILKYMTLIEKNI